MKMKAFKMGLIGLLACVTSLLANTHISQGFNVENPMIFWGGQIFMCTLIIVLLLHTVKNWDNTYSISKTILLRSICVWMFMYGIAYTEFKYSLVVIFIVGVLDSYITIKKFGLVK